MGVPGRWIDKWDPMRRAHYYYYSEATGQAQWDRPYGEMDAPSSATAADPDAWREAVSFGNKYYYHRKQRNVTIRRPPELGPLPFGIEGLRQWRDDVRLRDPLLFCTHGPFDLNVLRSHADNDHGYVLAYVGEHQCESLAFRVAWVYAFQDEDQLRARTISPYALRCYGRTHRGHVLRKEIIAARYGNISSPTVLREYLNDYLGKNCDHLEDELATEGGADAPIRNGAFHLFDIDAFLFD